ncbi:hypothetical protein [Sanguibacter sp. 25GB23B1]|uniref:hypothetical protein n=1 Tax=Sanguibacter sp. 25GB23B1 TaxID=3156067 RepID=UPI0032AF1EC9
MAEDRSTGASGLSRRSLREQTGVQRPVVVPPLQSNAIRTVDETGELSGLRDLGTGRSAPASPSARPSAEGARAPESQQPTVQRQPVQRQPVQRQPVQRQAVPGQPAQAAPGQGVPGQGAPVQPAPVQRQSLQGFPTRQPGAAVPPREQSPVRPGVHPTGTQGTDPGRRPWPPVDPAPSGVEGRSTAFLPPQVARPVEPSSPDVDVFQQRISAPEEASPTGPGPQDDVFVEELPRWDAITAAPAASPAPRAFPAVVAHADEELDDQDDGDFDDDDDDDDFDENEHKYTWLHYLILVAVAFVLGLIIWKVGLEGSGTAGPPDSSSVASIALRTEHTPDLYL